METANIQQLIDFISKSGLDEVNIETVDLKISVKRYGSGVQHSIAPTPVYVPAPVVTSVPQPVTSAPIAIAAPAAPPSVSESALPANLITIKSPMIGTFYRSANTTSPLFVEIGDEVKEGKVVCIIEAMKLFNEIESEVSGRVVKILVENATPVEYDQPLFLVEPI